MKIYTRIVSGDSTEHRNVIKFVHFVSVGRLVWLIDGRLLPVSRMTLILTSVEELSPGTALIICTPWSSTFKWLLSVLLVMNYVVDLSNAR